MAQDLRELFKKERDGDMPKMRPGHKERFHERLQKEFPQRRKPWIILLKIAASVLILIGIGTYYFITGKSKATLKTSVVEKEAPMEKSNDISLGDLSPDLKKVENYYVANINFELSKLEVSKENKAIVASFMDQLATLNAEYKKLNAELNLIGPNDQTITALIKNLQLRLQVLHRLKEKLNQLKSSKNEEVISM
ncbi:hypothetical protein [Pricia sp.]|uniref:hypothetical protein n=1 Tax=Pricia sp. TaxID=2268138 RepID=UPI003592FE93